MKARFTLLLAGLLFGAAGASAQTLRVDLQGVAHAQGSLRLALYAAPETFRKADKAFRTREQAAATGTVSVVFEDLPPGRYALLAYHDENGDGQLNRRLGMFPTEGYGLSNNPEVMGPPTFEASAFEVTGEAPAHLAVDMRY